MSKDETVNIWIPHAEVNVWECPKCRTQFELDRGNPETKGLNYCPVCGTKLVIPS